MPLLILSIQSLTRGMQKQGANISSLLSFSDAFSTATAAEGGFHGRDPSVIVIISKLQICLIKRHKRCNAASIISDAARTLVTGLKLAMEGPLVERAPYQKIGLAIFRPPSFLRAAL